MMSLRFMVVGFSWVSWPHLQGERRCENVSVDARLQEQLPRTGHGNEHADVQRPGRGRAAGDLRCAERARAPGRAGGADVRMEVVERSGLKEDRVRERAEPRRE